MGTIFMGIHHFKIGILFLIEKMSKKKMNIIVNLRN